MALAPLDPKLASHPLERGSRPHTAFEIILDNYRWHLEGVAEEGILEGN
jgi:hypothetical protein